MSQRKRNGYNAYSVRGGCIDMKSKTKKEPKPSLVAIHVKDTETNEVILQLPPTAAGEKRANYYQCLANIEVIKVYS